MIAVAQAESTILTGFAPVEQWVATSTPASVHVLVDRHDTARAGELELMAAHVEGAARNVGMVLFLAVFMLAFVVATMTGVLF
jgi:hypothetical protein